MLLITSFSLPYAKSMIFAWPSESLGLLVVASKLDNAGIGSTRAGGGIRARTAAQGKGRNWHHCRCMHTQTSIWLCMGMARTTLYGWQTSGRRKIRDFDEECARRGMASCHITVVSPSGIIIRPSNIINNYVGSGLRELAMPAQTPRSHSASFRHS